MLTNENMLLRKRAEEIVSLVDKIKAEIMETIEGISGDVSISDSETEGIRIIVKTAKRLQDSGYHIRFHFLMVMQFPYRN